MYMYFVRRYKVFHNLFPEPISPEFYASYLFSNIIIICKVDTLKIRKICFKYNCGDMHPHFLSVTRCRSGRFQTLLVRHSSFQQSGQTFPGRYNISPASYRSPHGSNKYWSMFDQHVWYVMFKSTFNDFHFIVSPKFQYPSSLLSYIDSCSILGIKYD